MATFGIYQVLDPLYVTPRGSVCSGKIVGGEATNRIAVKILNPPRPDPDEPNWEPKYFLDRAQVQRRVAATGGAHWAPVYALGFTPEGGAYYVTDYHALTAQKMIDGHVPLDAIALHAVIISILSGLDELRRIANRAHANLKPANVLLIGKGPADELRAVLADPGQDYKAEKDGEAGDLRAVGELIHALVLHRGPAAGQTPSAGEPGWEKLGDKADAWRQLCADLLAHPIPHRAATLASAIKIVEGLAPPRLRVPHLRLPHRPHKRSAPGKPAKNRTPRAPSKLKRRVVQLIAVLVVAGGVLGVLSMLEAKDRGQVCSAREAWFDAFATSLSEPQRHDRFAADPHLRRVLQTVEEMQQLNIRCENGKPRLLGFFDFYKTRKAAAALSRMQQDLSPESWPQLATLRDLARVFDRRGWQQPAGFTAQLLEGVRPTPSVTSAMTRPSLTPDPLLTSSGNLSQRIERLLRLRPIIEEQAEKLEGQWTKLEKETTALNDSPDPVIRGFGALLQREATSAVKLNDEGFDGAIQLEQSAGLAQQILAQLRNTPATQLDQARFASEVLRDMNVAELEPSDVKRWLSQRPMYVVKRVEIAQAADELQKSYQATSGEVAKSAPEPSEAAAFEQELKDVEAAMRDFRQSSFIARDITEGRFGQKVAQIQGQISNLKRYYHAENAADWLKNLAGVATASPRMKSFWEAWVSILRSDVDAMARDRAMFARNKTRTDNLRDALQDIEITIPQPPADLPGEFAAAAKQRREERIDQLVSAIDLANPTVKHDQLKQIAESTNAWFEDFKGLSEDFPVRKKLLTLEDRPDQRWIARPEFWKDPIVQRIVRRDVDRIERLQKLKSASREELIVSAKETGVRDEVVVAAWQELGDSRVSPDWPATPEELATEATLRQEVAGVLDTLDAAERKPLEEQLGSEGPRRWRRFVDHADAEPMLEAAIKQRDVFRVNGFVLAEMDARARYNVWLYLANLAIRENDPTGVAKVVENLSVAAQQLEESHKEAGVVVEKLSHFKVPEPFGDRDLGNVFRLEISGRNEPIEFRRIGPKDGARPFYLGTTEVTLGQFVGVLDGMKLWGEAQQLAWPYRPGKGDGRRGMRAWEWMPGTNRIAAPQYWMTVDQVNRHNDFPIDFHPEAKFNINVIDARFGGMPSEKHPMNYISAHAALFYANAVGCRLPTSTEWSAALAASGKTLEIGDWNLRDQSWEVFRKHAQKQGIALEHWPDRGAFPGDPAAGIPVKPPPPSRRNQDNTLLLRPEPSGDGTFHDLIGNVAELVCDRPDDFAKWDDKDKAAKVKTFLEETPDAMFVIGGSALSSPDVPIDKPLPVTRTDKGFSDVGLRLAFTAPSKNAAERLKWVLADQGYLWPRTASADTRLR